MTSDAETNEKANHFPDSVPSVKVKDSSIVTRDTSTYEIKFRTYHSNENTEVRSQLTTLSPRTIRWFKKSPRFCGSIPFVFRLD